jgi:hypothetical protein
MAQINELPESENNISPGKNTNMSSNSKMQESNAANSAQKSDAVSTSGVERSNSQPFSSLKDSSVKDTVRNPKAALKQAAATKVADMAGNTVSPEGKEAIQKTVEKTRSVKNIVKKTVATAKAFVTVVVPLLLDPIFWVGVLVINVIASLVIGVMATFQVVGRNENADGCGVAGSTNGVQAEDKGDWIGNANSIANWLMTTKFDFLGGQPMSLNQVAGIIGNWSQESQVDPKLVQNNFMSSSVSNEELAAVTGGGKAVGLAQWDGERRTTFANFAKQQGKHWTDINVQLEFFKTELEGWEGANLVAGGFNDPSKTAKDLVLIFEQRFERAGIPRMDNRYAGAEKFLANYKGGGGYTANTGGSCLNSSGGNLDTSDIVQLAISMSYPTSAESRVGPGDSEGRQKAKPEYLEGKKKAEEKSSPDPWSGLYASCDRFVATVIRLTRDPDIPWGSTTEQGNYLAKSPKWQQYTKKSEAKPGDIWVTRVNGHILLYLGDVNGRDTIAHASYLTRVAALGDANYLNENLVDTGGRAYYGYHFIG